MRQAVDQDQVVKDLRQFDPGCHDFRSEAIEESLYSKGFKILRFAQNDISPSYSVFT